MLFEKSPTYGLNKAYRMEDYQLEDYFFSAILIYTVLLWRYSGSQKMRSRIF